MFVRYVNAIKTSIIMSFAIILLQLVDHILWPSYIAGKMGVAIGGFSLATFPLLVLVAGLAGAICVRSYENQIKGRKVNIYAVTALSGFILGIITMAIEYILDLVFPSSYAISYYVPPASVCIVFTAPVSMTVLAIVGGLIYLYVYADRRELNDR